MNPNSYENQAQTEDDRKIALQLQKMEYEGNSIQSPGKNTIDAETLALELDKAKEKGMDATYK